MRKPKLLIVDAQGLCYRAYYAIKNLATSYGQPTNAIYGFVTMLEKIITGQKPDYVAVCFDVGKVTFRQKKFSDYKIQRPPTPDDLISQIPLIKEIISAYNLSIFEKEGFEADDLIATLAKRFAKDDLEIIVITSDKDMLQIVDKNIFVFNPYKEKEGIFYDEEKVTDLFGVKPKNIIDFLSLTGDSADNIPGVPGIGEKTAQSILTKTQDLNSLIKNIDKLDLSEKIKESLRKNIDMLNLNKDLVKLDADVDIGCELEELKITPPDKERLFALFKKLEFRRLVKDLAIEEEKETDSIKIREVDAKFLEKYDTFAIWLNKDDLNISLCVDKECIYQTEDPGLLTNPKIKKIGYDLKETKFFLAEKRINLSGIYFDVMIADYLVDSSKKDFSLSTLVWNNLGVIKNEEKLNFCEKANLIFKLKPILEEKLKQMQLSDLFFKLEMPLVEVLADMEINGIKVDVDFLNKLNKKIEERLGKLIKQIYNEAKEEFNINSPKQLSVILFEKLKLPVVKKIKTGFSTDEEVLLKLAKTHELPKAILEYRQLTKLKSTYIDGLLPLVDKNNKIHTTFSQVGTETGRLSSNSPNLQNIPIKTDLGQQIRKAFVTSCDCILSSDYSQIELRILAHLSEDENLVRAFKENQDVHKITAASIFGLDLKDVDDKMRETAKRINFGIIYGMSQFGLAKDLGITGVEAQNFIDAYFLRYPKVKDYIQKQIKLAEVQGFVTTILNRRRYLPGILSKNNSIRMLSQRQAVNTSVQGSAADLIKLAMLDIHQELKNKNLHSQMILQVHDELVFDVTKNELDEIKKIVKEKMENVIKLNVPIKVKISIGQNWLELEGG